MRCSDLVQAGACLTVGVNSNISIWNHPWVPSLANHIPKPLSSSVDMSIYLLVKDLMDHSGACWDLDILQQLFDLTTATWMALFSGHSLRQVSFQLNPPTISLSNHVFPRFGCEVVESASHLFFLCPFFRALVFSSKWGLRLELIPVSNVVDWIRAVVLKGSHFFPSDDIREEFLVFYSLCIESLWFTRNKILHDAIFPSLDNLVKVVEAKADDHWSTQCKKQMRKSSLASSHPWFPPKPGWLKLNCDAAFQQDLSTAGGVLRNHRGSIIFAFAHGRSSFNSLVAEVFAIRQSCF